MGSYRTAAAVALCLGQPVAALAQDDASTQAFVCAPAPAPVVTLDHGSRYAAQDASRTEFDAGSNADVNAQLAPVDDFITAMALAANRALAGGDDAQVAAECVLAQLALWARADALSDLGTMNAQLSAPSRIAGLAFAYAQVAPLLPRSDDRAAVEGWLSARAKATMAYFDGGAPPKASRNNLRAWAALAVARVGLTVGSDAMTGWADASVRQAVCAAAPDGSLPLEMARKELALHYQLHAVTPMVVTAALLQPRGSNLFAACDGALHRTVDFVLAAFDDPKLVKGIAGRQQTYFSGQEKLRGFEMAWATAYLSLFDDPALAAFVDRFGPLSNSKLGGRQSLLWRG